MSLPAQAMRMIESAVALLEESGQAGVEVRIVSGPGIHDGTRDYHTRVRYLPRREVEAETAKRH
ncbi:hypothetical protein TVVG_00041 [Tetraselmis viridis virus SI1]|uniref:hypothetical protein n=1 Tax=Tetraselmis viridis virus S20 TaxID=754070 RepID=UPI0002C0E2DF|nr:hypothetical protein TVGG_00007 [Tetraselmis viridis virus S20]AGH31335.1 hypothetical protein TVGG_00007 [Tetraselmis viridis virus S20]AGH31423.1 hypothetical protein TVVG_00041 [Tetraselmis viridis virus SI1]